MNTLDEYRKQLVDELRRSTNENAARGLIISANSHLQARKIAQPDQLAFWNALSSDVTILGIRANLLIEKQAAAALSQVVAAAQAAIARHQANLAKK